jgi:ribonuclease HII
VGVDLLALERSYWKRGYSRIAGVDEAGLGPLAGPVIASAVILPPRLRIAGANDSKQLTPRAREFLDGEIRARALAIGIGCASVEDIERLNIYQAGLLAMRRALDQLEIVPDFVLLDARTLPRLPWPQEAHIRGDASIHCVACASIIAKVFRDRLMLEYDQAYPEYGFAGHKGYATAAHRRALAEHGPCPIHRRSFHGVVEQLPLF